MFSVWKTMLLCFTTVATRCNAEEFGYAKIYRVAFTSPVCDLSGSTENQGHSKGHAPNHHTFEGSEVGLFPLRAWKTEKVPHAQVAIMV
jgi:hypothetical protein